MKLISFTITHPMGYVTYEYQAEMGMTWAKWCNSTYNIDNYIEILGDGVYSDEDGMEIGLNDTTRVLATDVIMDGYVYVLMTT